MRPLIKTIFLSSLFLLNGNANAQVTVQKDVEWDTAHHLTADIYQPQTNMTTPVVLLLHGGGWVSGSKEDMQWFGYHIAENGMTAISIDYRLVNKNTTPLQQYDDVKNALRITQVNEKLLNIDKNRIGVLGGSAGGHLAAMLSTEKNTAIKAAVILWGPTDLEPKYKLTDRATGMLAKYVSNTEQSTLDYFSPIRRVSSQIAKSWLIIHGQLDEIVPVEESRAFYASLRTKGIDSYYIELPGQKHSPESKQMQAQAVNSILMFLKSKL